MSESHRFPPLSRYPLRGKPPYGEDRRKKIAIFTPDVMGPLKNGGVGTASVAQAEALASWGHDVSLIYGSHEESLVSDFERWQEHYAAKGIRLIRVPKPAFSIGAPRPAHTSYAVWLFLKEHHFDIVHFCEFQGLGYYSLAAKKLGLGFERTLFCVTVHGPTAWHFEENRGFFGHSWQLALDYLERKSVELADVVVGVSQYALNWCAQRGWKLPKRCFVEPQMIPSTIVPPAPSVARKPKELVFFGRLESRKGIETFCEALERLPPQSLRGVTVTFLGGLGKVEGQPVHYYLRSRSRQWKFPWKLVSGYGQEQALRYLRSRPVLVVLPSRAETLGYTAIECIASGVPFLASRIEAYEALIAKKDHASTLFDDTDSLALMIQRRLRSSTRSRVGFARPPERTRAVHKLWHERVRVPQPCKPQPGAHAPRVSVCIAHKNRSAFLKECLASLASQDYSRFEVIVVDDGSDAKELRRFRELVRGHSVLRIRPFELKRSRGPGAARNVAAAKARGDYLLFMDDDNLALPEELRTFASAAGASGADVLTCACERFPGGGRSVPLGDSLACGAIRNIFGDANAFWKRKSFIKLKGFRESAALQEDAELLARAVISGMKLAVIPEPLFKYRDHPGSRSHAASDEGEGDFLRASAYQPLLRNPDLHSLFSATLGFERRTPGRPLSRRRALPVIPLFDVIQHGQAFPHVSTLFQASLKSGPRGRLRVDNADEGISFTLPGISFDGARTLHAVLEASAAQDFLVEISVQARVGEGERFGWISSYARIRKDPEGRALPLDVSRFRKPGKKARKRADLFLDATRFRSPIRVRIHGCSGTLHVHDFRIFSRA